MKNKNAYVEMKTRQQNKVNAFDGWFFAFNNKQFDEGMRKLGLEPEETDKIAPTIGGGFVLKDRAEELAKMFNDYERELHEAIEADTVGDGFICDMFVAELENHEFCYTGDYEDAIYSLGLTIKDVMNSIPMCNGLGLAIEMCMNNSC